MTPRCQAYTVLASGLFPKNVVTVIATDEPIPPPLLPDEEHCVERAVPKRRREFAVGRDCARRALASFGYEYFPILAGPDRAPIWPDGVTGSITHCAGFCGAAAVRQGEIVSLGFDAEPAAPLDPALVETVCTPAEAAMAGLPPGGTHGEFAMVIFSAKEAVHKCIWPVCRTALEFQDVEVTVSGQGRLTARLVGAATPGLPEFGCLEGRYAIGDGHILTGFVLWRDG